MKRVNKIKASISGITFLLILLFQSACIEKRADASGVNEPQQRLRITAQKGFQTRGLEEGSFSPGAELGIFLTDQQGNRYDQRDYANYKYTASGNGSSQVWNTLEPVYLSPTKGRILAYYPYTHMAGDYSSIPVSAGETDYMYSSPVENVSSQYPDVNLLMHHALSCIRIKVKRGSYTNTGILSHITIQSGSFAKAALLNAETGQLSALSGIGTPVRLSAGNKTIPTGSTVDYDLLVIPTTDPGDITIELTMDGKEYSCVAAGPASKMEQGGIYSYTVTVNNDALSLSDLVIDAPGDIDEEGNLIIDVGGYKVKIGGNTHGIAYSYQVSNQVLTLYAVSVNQEQLVNSATLSPAGGGTFSQTGDDTAKTITLSNLNQDVTILFNGVRDKITYITYTLTTNQGNPDVYLDGYYMGRCSGGRFSWRDIAYDTHKQITLENVTEPTDDMKYPIYYIGGYSQKSSRGIFKSEQNMYGKVGETIVYKNLREIRHWQARGWEINTSGTLYAGQTSIAIDYLYLQGIKAWDEDGDPFTSYKVTSYPYPDDWEFEWDASTHSLSVTYGINRRSCTIVLGSEKGGVINTHFSRD